MSDQKEEVPHYQVLIPLHSRKKFFKITAKDGPVFVNGYVLQYGDSITVGTGGVSIRRGWNGFAED